MDATTRIQSLLSRWEEHKDQGDSISVEELCARCPELAPEMRRRIALLQGIDRALDTALSGDDAPGFGSAAGLPPSPEVPAAIGRFRVVRPLGQGGFGRVYLARDEELDRLVAIKVPTPERMALSGDVELFLREARILASLDHPHIVPVHDVGRTSDGVCYIVSKFIEGSSLADRLQRGRLSIQESAEIVATVAHALHHAHKRGLAHRDVKPPNILIDAAGQPFVADFGLALRDQDFGRGIAVGEASGV
jgi:serine/threonine protein kinase